MGKTNNIITIDGPAAAGKSTIAKKIAEKLNWLYLDTGAIYRAVAILVIKAGIGDDNENEIKKAIEDSTIDIKVQKNENFVFLNNSDITKFLRSQEVSEKASVISALPKVREAVLGLQRNFGLQGEIVVEGRDMGTVVFPEAKLKVFLTADVEIRAKRRLKDLNIDENNQEAFQEILKDIIKRDERDQNRVVAPLKKPLKALEINSSALSIEEISNLIIEEYEKIK